MIEIFAVTYNGQPAAASVRGAFGPEGGTLGRGPDNRLPLPDPARHVSRVQARVRHDGARYWISNISEANPLFLNDEELESGRERPIVPGDELRVGLYVLRVRTPVGPSIDYRPAQSAARGEQTLGSATGSRGPASPLPAAVSIDGMLSSGSGGANPFADLLGGAAPLAQAPMPAVRPVGGPAVPAADPFAGLITPSSKAAPAAAPGKDPLALLSPAPSDPFADLLGPPSSPRAAPPPRPGSGPISQIPDDFNPFAMPATPARNTADPLAELAKNSIDLDALSGEKRPSLIDFDPSAKIDPRDALRGGTPSLVDPLQAVDPMKLFGGSDDNLVAPDPGFAPGGKPMRDDFGELGANFTPPRALPDRQAPVRAAAPPPTDDPIARQSELLAALVAPSVPAPAAPPRQPAAEPPRAAGGSAAALSTPARSPPPATPFIGDASIGMRAASAPSAASDATAVAPAAAPAPSAPAPGAAAVALPPVAAPSAAPPPRQMPPAQVAAAPASASTASTAALLAAFLEGANAQALNVPGGLTPDMMRTMGKLVYQAVAGAMTLISARQITKREMGAEVTMIVPKGNNPLKFLPTPEAALMQILGPKMPGFMTSVDAMQDAFEDLRAHEVGVIAGTRAALSAVLKRFDPKSLEERLGTGGLFENLVPSTRRAKLWAAFEAQFNEVYREAEEDFNKLFGEAFIEAYEAEVARHRAPR